MFCAIFAIGDLILRQKEWPRKGFEPGPYEVRKGFRPNPVRGHGYFVCLLWYMKIRYNHPHKSEKHLHKWKKYQKKHKHSIHHRAARRAAYTKRYKASLK